MATLLITGIHVHVGVGPLEASSGFELSYSSRGERIALCVVNKNSKRAKLIL